jgi:hypothetical protein
MPSSLKIKKMTTALKENLGLDFSGKEPRAYYYLGGKRMLRVRITNVHGGDTLSIGAATKLRNSLRLDWEGLKMLYECPMSGKEYENRIKGILNKRDNT